jgi:hypothetical protein
MRDGITPIIHGYLDQDPPCLGASVRAETFPGDGEEGLVVRQGLAVQPDPSSDISLENLSVR